jgi:hypothetical protein
MADLDLTFVDETIQQIGRGPEAVIPILQRIQDHYRYLPDEALQRLCDRTDITPASIEGVSTFYTQFRRQPVGRHTDPHLRGNGLPRQGRPDGAGHVSHRAASGPAARIPMPTASSRSRGSPAWAAVRWRRWCRSTT